MAKRSIKARAKEMLKRAQALEEEGATWVEAHNGLFGIGGPNVRLFPTREERTAFSATEEYGEIHEILEGLPNPKGPNVPLSQEMSGQFRVRIPKTMHAALSAEAEAEGVSLNQLVVAKLAVQLRALV